MAKLSAAARQDPTAGVAMMLTAPEVVNMITFVDGDLPRFVALFEWLATQPYAPITREYLERHRHENASHQV